MLMIHSLHSNILCLCFCLMAGLGLGKTHRRSLTLKLQQQFSLVHMILMTCQSTDLWQTEIKNQAILTWSANIGQLADLNHQHHWLFWFGGKAKLDGGVAVQSDTIILHLDNKQKRTLGKDTQTETLGSKIIILWCLHLLCFSQKSPYHLCTWSYILSQWLGSMSSLQIAIETGFDATLFSLLLEELIGTKRILTSSLSSKKKRKREEGRQGIPSRGYQEGRSCLSHRWLKAPQTPNTIHCSMHIHT